MRPLKGEGIWLCLPSKGRVSVPPVFGPRSLMATIDGLRSAVSVSSPYLILNQHFEFILS